MQTGNVQTERIMPFCFFSYKHISKPDEQTQAHHWKLDSFDCNILNERFQSVYHATLTVLDESKKKINIFFKSMMLN